MNKKTALNVIKELTSNQDLQAVLLSQFGDYAHTPSTASFFLHASVANHYFEGGWYPRGGSAEIANNIIPVIERTGGRVLVGREVKNIIIRYIPKNSSITIILESCVFVIFEKSLIEYIENNKIITNTIIIIFKLIISK